MAEVLTFSRHYYRPESIEATAGVYADFVDIAIEVGETDVVVTLDDPDPELADSVGSSFANHALFETIKLHRSELAAGSQA